MDKVWRPRLVESFSEYERKTLDRLQREYTPENVIVNKGSRVCRICDSLRKRRSL